MKALLIGALVLGIAGPARAQLAPPNAAGITYGHVALNVKDVNVEKKIFVEQFGGIAVQKGTLTAVKFPNMLIVLQQAEPTGGSEGTAMDHFGFKVRDIAEILQGWRAAGYVVTREFTGAEGFPNAYLAGPDNMKLELQEDKTLPAKAMPNHIHFVTADYVKLLDWYADTFSLVKRARGTIQTTADAPGLNLSFMTSRMPSVPTKGRSIDHIGFEVTNLEAFCKKLEASGVKFDVPYRDVPSLGLKTAYLTDPSGVSIELTEGLNKYLSQAQPWRPRQALHRRPDSPRIGLRQGSVSERTCPMKIRIAVVVALLMLAVGAWGSAQAQFQLPQLQGVQPVQPPIVLSGSDIGFRVDGRKGDSPVGRLVVRVNGQWVDAEISGGGVKRLSMK